MGKYTSPAAKPIIIRAFMISLIFTLVFVAVMIAGFVLGRISEQTALIIGVLLMLLNSAQLVPALLKANRIQEEYDAENGGGNNASG